MGSIRLAAKCVKPELKLSVVAESDPRPRLPLKSYEPPWGVTPLPRIEFKLTHVDALQAVRRKFVLTAHTNAVAKWKLFHVAMPPPNAPTLISIKEREDAGATDDPRVFSFDIVQGALMGPSRKERALPLGPCLPKAWNHDDAEFYEPQHVEVAFKPKENVLYKSKFRLQVEAGAPLDFICVGCGSYDEEDDVNEVVEA